MRKIIAVYDEILTFGIEESQISVLISVKRRNIAHGRTFNILTHHIIKFLVSRLAFVVTAFF